MAINIKNTKQVTNDGIKILVYGQAGAGKTRLITTLSQPIVLSSEAGLLSISQADIPYIEIHTLEELYESYKYCKDNIEKYNCIVLDSISEIGEKVLMSEKEKSKDPRQAYGNLLDVMTGLIRAFRDLPTNVYFSAKMERIQDENGRLLYGPSLPGTKLSQAIPYFFDEVFCLRVENNQDTGANERWLQTMGDSSYIAKDRSGKLNAFEAPDLGAIIKKIGGK